MNSKNLKIAFKSEDLETVAKKFLLKFIILHGSVVSGSLHKESDFDIAVLGQKKIDFETILELYEPFERIFKLPVGMDLDIKSLHDTDPLFRYEVISNSKLLFGAPEEYEEFKAVSQRMFEDAQPLFLLERQLAYKFQRYLNTLHAK